MKVTLKYDQGIKANEVVSLEIPAQEFETMIEFDYQERLMKAEEGELVERRTSQEILDEMNRIERNSWRRYKEHTSYSNVVLKREDDQLVEEEIIDTFADNSQLEDFEKEIDYEEQCQKIRQLLKPDQADMVIAICLDGVRVKDYAEQIGITAKQVTDRLSYAKQILRENVV